MKGRAPSSVRCPFSAASSVHTVFPITTRHHPSVRLPAAACTTTAAAATSATNRFRSSANAAIADQVAAGEPGIIGVMLESLLVDGRQDFTGRANLTVGQSITDACMGWDMTVPVLRELAAAVCARRATLGTAMRRPEVTQGV